MKKEYKKPVITIDLLDEKDIIITSDTVIGGKEEGDVVFDIDKILHF